MSCGICRVAKAKNASAITGAQLHDRRERNHSNSNPDIDFSRSIENQTFIDIDFEKYDSYNDYINKQIQARYKGTRAIRKDAVKMIEVIFTSDSDFFKNILKEQENAFFQSCLDFAKERWGEENIISAIVHNDEKTPHLHLNFIPLTKDGRLSAKDVLGGKKELQQLQDDFFHEVSEKFGLERGNRCDLNDPDDIPARHKTISELKRETRARELDAEIKEKTAAVTATETELSEKLHQIEICAEKTTRLDSIKEIKFDKTAFGNKIKLAKEDYDKLTDLAERQIAADNHNQYLEMNSARLEREHDALIDERERLVKRLDEEKERAAEEKRGLYEQISALKKENREIRSVRGDMAISTIRSERDNYKRKLDKVLEFIKGRGLWETLKAFYPAISSESKGQRR